MGYGRGRGTPCKRICRRILCRYARIGTGWRGIAAVDMAYAIRQNRPHRSSPELALHTVELMSVIEDNTADGKVHTMVSHPERPKALPHGFFGPINVMEAALATY